MRGILILISCLLLACFVLEKSGALRMAPYSTREGTVKVEKKRLDWHPERFVSYFKGLSKKWIGPIVQKGSSLLRGKKERSEKPTHRLILKKGIILKGSIVERDGRGVLFESEGGKIFFDHSEISSVEKE